MQTLKIILKFEFLLRTFNKISMYKRHLHRECMLIIVCSRQLEHH